MTAPRKPSFRRNVIQHVRVKVTRKGVALKKPVQTTFRARAHHTRIAAFGQKAYTYSGLRKGKAKLGLK